MKYLKEYNINKSNRYFFTQDDSSHWYMIPLDWKEEWDVISEDPNGWELDEWQKFEDCRLNGGINFSFENPLPIK